MKMYAMNNKEKVKTEVSYMLVINAQNYALLCQVTSA